jgi:hypothetical protein
MDLIERVVAPSFDSSRGSRDVSVVDPTSVSAFVIESGRSSAPPKISRAETASPITRIENAASVRRIDLGVLFEADIRVTDEDWIEWVGCQIGGG